MCSREIISSAEQRVIWLIVLVFTQYTVLKKEFTMLFVSNYLMKKGCFLFIYFIP